LDSFNRIVYIVTVLDPNVKVYCKVQLIENQGESPGFFWWAQQDSNLRHADYEFSMNNSINGWE
jgi:hypothetical protein